MLFHAVRLFILVSFVPILTSTQVSAQSLITEYKICVSEARAELEKPRKIEAYRDRGCASSQTNWKGERQSCTGNVCWDAPPHNIVVEAHVWDHSASGSEHRYGSTQYLPSREFATKFCNSVHARSPSGAKSGRGWQKLSADVTVTRQITPAEREKIEAECEKKVLENSPK